FAPERIMLTSQMPSRRLEEFVERRILYNACSLHQLDRFGHAFAGRDVTIRVNPGLGSGSIHRVNTGGPASSFGIWHEYLDEAKATAARHRVTIRRLDTRMTEVTRPSLYGAQHPIEVVASKRPQTAVVFVGPCCETGDILTPASGDPEALAPREVPLPEIGDLVVVGGAGAYCAAMSTSNYNSYPTA